MSVMSRKNFKSINRVSSKKTRYEKVLKKFLISNIVGRNRPIFLGNELVLMIYKSYICAKF